MGEDDGEAPPIEDSPTKVLGGVDISVDDEGVGEAPHCDVLAEVFGEDEVGEVN